MDPLHLLRELWNSFAFTRLLRTFRLSVAPGKILIAMMAIVLIAGFGWFMDRVTVRTQNHERVKVMMPKADMIGEFDTPIDWPLYQDKNLYFGNLDIFCAKRGVFSTLWNTNSTRFHVAVVSLFELEFKEMFLNLRLCGWTLQWAIQHHGFYSFIFLTFVVVVMSFTGGAICRLAALEFSRGEKPGLTEAIKFSWVKLGSFLMAPSIPIIIMVAAGFMIVMLGLVGNIPYAGKIIMAVGVSVALVIGLVITLFLVGTVFGAHLMLPTIAYEGSNGMDAISRSFAYVYAHPWAITFYYFLAWVYGSISYLMVRLFGFLLLLITYKLIDIGFYNAGAGTKLGNIWPKPEFFNFLREDTGAVLTGMELASSIIINVSVLTVVGLLIAFVISFYFCACTIIYGLMREKVDKMPTDHIYIHLDQARD